MPLSILFLAHRLDVNDGRIAKQAASLAARGHKVGFVSLVEAGGAYPSLPGAELLDWRGHAQRRMPLALALAAARRTPRLAGRIAEAAARRAVLERHLIAARPDIVIASDPETLAPAARAKPAGGFRLIYDAHEFYPEETPNDAPRRAWVEKVQAAAGPRLDGFITVNENIVEAYAASAPALPRASVIHNAAPRQASVPPRGRMRAALGLSDTAPLVLFHGGFAPDRGLPALVAAMNQVRSDWTLALLGGGKLEPSLGAAAGPRVRFLPTVPFADLASWIVDADLGCILYEPTCANQRLASPNKLWEYPSVHVPVLASDLPFVGAMVRRHGLGFLTAVAPGAIAAALDHVTPHALSAARAACAAFAQHATWEAEAERFVALVEAAATH